MKNLFIVSSLAFALCILFVPRAGNAQDQGGPSVARVSITQGQVSTQHADGGDWAEATINTPLQGGDSVSTSDRSRTEVQFNYANVMRLDQDSVVKVADLSQSRIQLQLAQGLMEYSVLNGGQGGAEIDTPNVAVQPTGDGVYRIQVDPNSQQTWVTVRRGQVQVSTPQGSQNVEAGQTMVIQGTDNPQFQVNEASGNDEFDAWAENRDRQVLEARSWEHTNRNYTGSGDLDRYGRWRQVPDYGEVWEPYESSNWVPYADGRWVWEPYYGWTWDSYEPWGWAPYHYGRWFVDDDDDNWVWWPGPVYADYYPVWAPAYVSFFGFGSNWGFGFGFGYGGFGSIGWLPLGPFDSGYRWWGAGFNNGFTQVNITNITNVYNTGNPVIRPMPPLAMNGHYPRISNVQLANSDPRVRRGVTVTTAQNFASGRVVRQGTPVSAAAFRGAKAIQSTPPVQPARASLSPSGQFTSRTALPRAANTRPTFFTRGQAGVAANGTSTRGGFGGRTTAPTVRGSVGAQSFGGGAIQPGFGRGGVQPNRSGPAAVQGGARANTGMGWQRFGRTAPNANAPGAGSFSRGGMSVRPQAAPAPSQRPGWQRFGTSSSPQPVRAPAQRPASSAGNWGRFSPTPAPSRPSYTAPIQRPAPNNAGGWQRFSQSPSPSRPSYSAPRFAPAPSNWGRSAPQSRPSFSAPRAQPAPSNWGRSAPQYHSAPAPRYGGWSAPAPSYNRAPLGSSRPIVSPPRSYNYGGGNGGGYHAAPAPSYEGGGRSYGGGGYHAAPAPSYEGGGRSYGGGGYHAAPAPSYEGGGRSYGGGGYHAAPAPSYEGGGRSYGGGGYHAAPAPSYGGGGGGRSYGGGGGGGYHAAPSGGGGGGRSSSNHDGHGKH